jgi:release factor glutamine methyltransferase
VTLTIGETLLKTQKTLSNQGITEAPLEAVLLLGVALGIDKVTLYASLEEAVSKSVENNLAYLVRRRANREPLPYLLGNREFFAMSFYVRPGIFIPRPETEHLVERTISIAISRFPDGGAVIVDVGTGSGAVTVSLAVNLPSARLYGTDVSEVALEVAKDNARRHGVADRTRFLYGDLLAPVPETVDLVVANLPYIKSAVIPTLEPEISQFEPREALDGGVDGLELIRRLLHQAENYLRPQGSILLELDPEQMDAATEVAQSIYVGSSMTRSKDLAGHERVLVIKIGERQGSPVKEEHYGR